MFEALPGYIVVERSDISVADFLIFYYKFCMAQPGGYIDPDWLSP